jgi:hypothetical protein
VAGKPLHEKSNLSLEASDAARHGRPSLHSLQAAKMNGVDPLAWLSQSLTRIADRWPASDLELPMPWNFKLTRSSSGPTNDRCCRILSI